jgi:hypothetical protein
VAEKGGKHTDSPIIINTDKENLLRTKHWRERVGKNAKYDRELGVLFSTIGSSAQTNVATTIQ